MQKEQNHDPDHKPTLDSGAHEDEAEGLSDVALRHGESSTSEKQESIGPYRVLGEIGRGGMGVVYKAFDPKLNRNVALKVLIAGEDASEDAIARFHREAEAVARLGHHPNIVPVYDVGAVTRDAPVGTTHASPLHYIAMHYVDGLGLDRMIDEGAIPPKRAASLAAQLARALHHAHRHGILHRDVKPANILLARHDECRVSSVECSEDKVSASPGLNTEHSTLDTSRDAREWVPMLTDFGLAKDVESESRVTRSGVTLGTPQYMPPEQAEGQLEEVDERSDVYSLGATLYEMLTTSPPFTGSSPFRIVNKVLLHEPVPPRKRNPAVDRDIETICLKCLEKDPERRYATARALAEDLERYVRGEAVRARPAGLVYRLSKKAKRHKALVGLGAVSLAVLVTGAVLGAVLLSREAGKTETERLDKEEGKRLAEKRDRVSKVLLGAYGILGDVQRDLKRRSFGESRSEEERKRDFRAHEKAIESFRASVPDEPDARSVFLAVRGWLRLVGSFPKEAEALFDQAREEDPEVAWADLFEALGLLVKYTVLQSPPEVVIRSTGPVFRDLPGETEKMGELRARFEEILTRAAQKPVGGEEANRFREVLEAFRGYQEQDLARAEQGLTEALSHWAMVWMREEILLARGKLRYLRHDFDGALEDALEHLRGAPGSMIAHNYVGLARIAMALKATSSGKDPVPIYNEALGSLDEAVRLKSSVTLLNTRGNALRGLGDALARRGGDPRDTYLRAIRDFDEVLRMAPGFAQALNNRGLVRLNMGEAEEKRGSDPRPHFEEALRDLSRALEKMPSHASVLANRGLVSFRLGNSEKKRGLDPVSHLESAIRDLTEALAIEPGQPGLLTTRAQAHQNLGEWEAGRGRDPNAHFARAREDFDAALEKDPEDFTAISMRGTVHTSTGEWQVLHGIDSRESYVRALRDFEKALLIDPGHVKTLSNHGGALRRLGEAQASSGVDPRPSYRKGVASCEEAIRLQKDYASAHFHLSALLLKLAETELMHKGDPRDLLRRAIESAGEAMRLDPRAVNPYVNRANGWRALGDYQSLRGIDPMESFRNALADFEKATLKKPGDIGILINRSTVHLGMGRAQIRRGQDPGEALRKAVEDCDAALRSNPNLPGVYVNRGIACKEMGDAVAARGADPSASYRKALASFDEAVRRDPRFWRGYLAKGNLFDQLGRYAEALEAFERARGIVGDRLPALDQWIAKAREKAEKGK